MNAINSGAHRTARVGRNEAEGYDHTGQGVEAQDRPPEPAQRKHGWEPGQRVHFAGRDWDILAISDNGLYVGRTRGGVAFDVQYLNLNNVTVQAAKWAK